MRTTRCFWRAESAVDASTSKIASTRVSDFWACWPPGPLEREKRSWISATGMETDLVTLQDIFVFRHQGIDSEGRVLGQLEPTGLRPSFSQRLAQRGLSVEAALFGSERTLVEVGR